MPSPDRPLDVEVRRATDDDLPAVLELAQAALGWRPDDPNDAFFRWKHLDNPVGRRPCGWRVDGDRRRRLPRVPAVAVRRRRTGDRATAVRAVDTATDPDHQGRGIFRRLTLGAVDELPAEGVDFVFNTPNDQSRPGYLKMGWQVVGRLPIAVRPRSPASAYRMARARTAGRQVVTADDRRRCPPPTRWPTTPPWRRCSPSLDATRPA